MLRTSNGTLLAMIEARKFSCDDAGFVDLRSRRSYDNGKTWTKSKLVYSNSSVSSWTTVGDANMVQDSSTGVIWMVHTRNNSRLFLSHSPDEGATWSSAVDVTSDLKAGSGWVGTGHSGGIQLSQGPSKGRLLIPTYTSKPYAIISDDHGKTWRMGNSVPISFQGAENTMAETGTFAEDGTPILLVSIRPGKGNRVQALSKDGGLSWSAPTKVRDLPEPIGGCEGSLVYHPVTKKLYFSHPDPPFHLLRNNLRIWSSSDAGGSWQKHGDLIWKGSAGYSSIVVLGADLGLLYDRNNHTMIIFEAQSVSFTTVEA